jgi:hypothetical protein
MPPILLGLVWAATFAVPVSLLSRVRLRIRPRRASASRPAPRSGAHSAHSQPPQQAKFVTALRRKGTVVLLAVNLVLLYVVDGLAFYAGRPMMTFGGLVPLILLNLVLMVITAAVSTRGRLNAGSAIAVLATVTFGTVWLVGHNSGHNAYLASHLVSVTVAPGDQLPASSTDHMVIVSPDIATTKASQAMATGVAGQRNYSTYL